MKLAVCKETARHESRVAATPDTVARYIKLGFHVTVESGAGKAAGFEDTAYREAGAEIAADAPSAVAGADILLAVAPPASEALQVLASGAALVGMLSPHNNPDIAVYEEAGAHAFALEKLPRISRAQSMDVLSSQSNLAGYRAVIDAFAEAGKVAPMMMTAAGTIAPARVLILGAGVAGLQAIATAKRLGAIVSAFDVRAAAREQVESLGGKFIEVPAEDSGEGQGGYAREMSDAYKQKQAELLFETLKKQDIVITTALIPGKPAPNLISKEMVEAMKPGAVIVDLATVAGGNCALSKPDKIVTHKGVKIVGHSNLASRVAPDASALYARNLYHFVSTLLVKDGAISIAWSDELVRESCITRVEEPALTGEVEVMDGGS